MPSLGNEDKNDKTDEILHKKQNQLMAVQPMRCFFLHHKNLKRGWYLGNDDENDEINETLCLTSVVFVCFYCKGFYICNEDHCSICMILGVNYVITSLVCFIIYCNSF